MPLTTPVTLAVAEVSWLYVGACLVVPLVWGVLTELVFRLLAKRFKHRRHHKDDHFIYDIEYHI